jgi:hypothetical protein
MTLDLLRVQVRLKAHMPRIAVIAVCAVCAAAFLPALEGDILSWDDGKYLSDPAIQGTTCFWERLRWIFTSFYFSNYNPLHRIGYWMQLSLWGLDPRCFHLLSILIHLANTALVYVLATRLELGRATALTVAAFFGAHPTRVEVVAWISAQKDLLSTFFALCSLCVYAPILTGAARGTPRRLGAVGVLFLLALLSKSMLVVYPLLLLALDLAWRRPLLRSVMEKLPFLAASGLFAALTLEAGARAGPIDGSWTVHAATSLQAPLFYVRRLLWPWDFSARWWVSRPADLLAPGPLLGVAVVLVAAVLLFRGFRSRDRRLAILAIAWPAVCLLPVLNIVPIPIVVADRYLYLALLGPLLAAAVLWQLLERHHALTARAAAGWSMAALVILFAVFAFAHCRAFRDSDTFWRTSLAVQPQNPIVRLQLAATILHQDPSRDRAREVLDLMSSPADWASERQQYLVTRARALEVLGLTEDSRREIERALALAGRGALRFETAVAMAKWLVRDGKHAEAHAALDAFVPRYDEEEDIILNAHLEVSMAAEDDAGYLRWSARLLSRSPFDLQLWHGRYIAASRLGDAAEAERSEARLTALLPDWRRSPARESETTTMRRS